MPNRAGLATASDTPAENVKAARTPSTPATAPAIAGSTGTADRPRPGSSAKRAPTTAATGSPAAVAAAATADPRGAVRARLRTSADQVRAAVPTATRSTATAQPTPRTSQSASKPGSGSASEARPIGVHSEAISAAATPIVAPAAAARPGATAAHTAACRRVRPTACRTRRSSAATRGVPGDRLADQEQGGEQRREPEGEQARRLVPGGLADRRRRAGRRCPTRRCRTGRSPGPGRP